MTTWAFGQFQYPTVPLRADAEAKRKAIEGAYQSLTPEPLLPDWSADRDLLDWLDRFCR
jgi:integrase/recombinase XerD